MLSLMFKESLIKVRPVANKVIKTITTSTWMLLAKLAKNFLCESIRTGLSFFLLHFIDLYCCKQEVGDDSFVEVLKLRLFQDLDSGLRSSFTRLAHESDTKVAALIPAINCLAGKLMLERSSQRFSDSCPERLGFHFAI